MAGSGSATPKDALGLYSLSLMFLLPVLVMLAEAVGWRAVYVLIIVPPIALALGAISLVRIRRARGELTGKANALGGIGLSALGVAFALFYLFLVLPTWHSLGCYLNLEGMPLVFSMYSGDWGALPPADSWCDALDPYFQKGSYPFVCPARPNLRSGYAMNRALSCVRVEDIQTPLHLTVLVFESDAGWNASGGPELLPAKPRHRSLGLRYDTYGYVGGTMNSSTPPVAKHERPTVIDGTAGIFWDPETGRDAGAVR